MIKVKIGIFGRMNSGKSTLFNALTGQQGLSIVAPKRGTTTDPVRRAYELLDYGAVTFVDTAGFDDSGELGEQRIQKTMEVAMEVDIAIVLLIDKKPDTSEREFVEKLQMPVIELSRGYDTESVLSLIKQTLESKIPPTPPFYGDILPRGGTVILVCPIDSEAPAGRMILPQVQAIRSALDISATCIVVQPSELESTIQRISADLVVTDSQAFKEVAAVVKGKVALTSFSILLAAQRGDIVAYKEGLRAVDRLKKGDRVLLLEHCSHGVSCDDIGRVKIPRLLSRRLGFEVDVDMVSGRERMPEDLSQYSLAVQCGGCMVSRGAIVSRILRCREVGLPVTNYGLLLQHLLLGAKTLL